MLSLAGHCQRNLAPQTRGPWRRDSARNQDLYHQPRVRTRERPELTESDLRLMAMRKCRPAVGKRSCAAGQELRRKQLDHEIPEVCPAIHVMTSCFLS
mmetsp:Transcript_109765/g.321357  ORF Transcript_109765/g.321357 Transcript_109765/m.321357 type:complete len:98 (-) Transcript_109765:182-475(-)